MRRFFVVSLLFVFCSLFSVVANGQRAELFTIRGAALSQERTSPASVREAEVDVNAAALRGIAAESISLTVFDERTYTAVRTGGELRADGGSSWIGKIDGEYDVILTRGGSMVSGLIYTPKGVFELAVRGGRHTLIELDHDLFPECYGDLSIPFETRSARPADAFVPAGGTDSGDLVDVLVLYTTAVKNVLGGHSQAQQHAQAAIDATNAAYINSGIRQRVRLIHSEEFAFTETGNSSNDLSSLRTNPGVAAIRDAHKADLVAMIGEVTDVCGIGYLITSQFGNAPYGFSITARSCAVGNLSFAHELGHNMGSHHNPENASSTPAFPFSYGHYINGSLRTVMSYTNPCSGGCPRIPYFSTPGKFYLGLQLGIEDARDNVRSIEQTADVTARYRYSGSSITLNSFEGGERIPRNITREVTWTSDNVAGDVRIELSRDESRTWQTLTTTANDGSATINISGRPTRRARIRVVSVDAPAVTDSSVRNITIQ